MTIGDEPMGDEVHDSPIDRLREAPVGTNDPNIVGGVGPTDVPPGEDPPNLARQVGDEPPEDPPDLDTISGSGTYGD